MKVAVDHGTPQIMLHALHPDEHVIKVPLVTGLRMTATQTVGKAVAKFLAPSPNVPIRDDDVPLGQQEFNISKAQSEHVIQPDSTLMISPGKR